MGRELVTKRHSLARPIIVRQGALADDVPRRDLYLTHGHALYLDGVLIPVENLINHRSIICDEAARVVEYYHLEVEGHDVVLAEGVPAETYYDAGNRALFHNSRPGSAPGNAKPTFAPISNGGEVVERIWAELAARAGGTIVCEGTTDDPDLHLIVSGRRLDATETDGSTYTFSLTEPPAGSLLLRSRYGIPSLLGVTRHDHRQLGVALSWLELRQSGIATRLAHDVPLFEESGCYKPEAGYVWTDGELALPARLFAHLTGAFTLTVHTERPGMRYPFSSLLTRAA